MSLQSYVRAMPKVELHVHLEGSIRPETLLSLAKRNGVPLPADTVEGLQAWYTFTDFPHFIEVYLAASKCIRTPDDIEQITREFLIGQSKQSIVHSEVTYTPYRHYLNNGVDFPEQLVAINRARQWAKTQLGVTMTLTLDYPRELDPEGCLLTADWAINGMNDGVSALGLGGPEVDNPPEKFGAAFDRAHGAGLACVPHAGETEGPGSIWGALQTLHAARIGHGVRCLEDPALVEELRGHQTPLEVCPTSNVCLKVFDDLSDHTLPHLLEQGLFVTVNSDDPPMFNTTLTDEYIAVAETFDLEVGALEDLVVNAVRASFLPETEKNQLENRFKLEMSELRQEHL